MARVQNKSTNKPNESAKATKNIKKKPEVATNERMVVKSQNYIYAFLILAGSIALAVYIFSWYQVKQEEKLMTSYLLSSKTIESVITDMDSLAQIMQETPSSYFIYLGYTNNEEVYELETNLKRVIDKYKLNDIFYYIDVTELMKKDNYLDEIKNKLNLPNLDNVPAIIYVNNGSVKESDVLDGVDGTMLKVNDLEQLIDIYEFNVLN